MHILVHDIFPWLVLEIVHTFVRILVVCLILSLNDCAERMSVKTSNFSVDLLLSQFTDFLAPAQDDLDDTRTSLALCAATSISHPAEAATSAAFDL